MQKFCVHQTTDSFPTELNDMTEWQVYNHVRTRIGMEAAEVMSRALNEKGAATVRGIGLQAVEIVFEIRPQDKSNQVNRQNVSPCCPSLDTHFQFSSQPL
jgi:hypothetical protein